jgi:hypothetical protein
MNEERDIREDDERRNTEMEGMEKRLEKTRRNKEVSDVSAFKCFLLQSRSPPPLTLSALRFFAL